jgi:hypothetical protein
MQINLAEVLRSSAALVAGCVIGLSFGALQDIALRRHQKREQNGNFNSGWAVMPGSMRRVAWLLIALVIVQILCPILFVGASQWWVSGGVVAGYGYLLFRRLRQRSHLQNSP